MPVDRSMLAELAVGRRARHAGVRRLRPRPRARGRRDLLLDVLRRLPRAREGARLRRAQPRAGLGRRCAEDRARRAAAALRARASRSPPKRRGAGRTTRRCTSPRGRPATTWPHAARPAVELLELASLALTGIRRAKTDAKASQKTPVLRVPRSPRPRRRSRCCDSAESDLRAVGRIAELAFVEAEEFEVRDVVFEAPSE